MQNNSNPNLKLFSRDRLHLNAEGYVAWVKALLPILKNKANSNDW